MNLNRLKPGDDVRLSDDSIHHVEDVDHRKDGMLVRFENPIKAKPTAAAQFTWVFGRTGLLSGDEDSEDVLHIEAIV